MPIKPHANIDETNAKVSETMSILFKRGLYGIQIDSIFNLFSCITVFSPFSPYIVDHTGSF